MCVVKKYHNFNIIEYFVLLCYEITSQKNAIIDLEKWGMGADENMKPHIVKMYSLDIVKM